jgi:hypothetical protein
MGQGHRALELTEPGVTFFLSFGRGVMRRRYFLEAHPLSPRSFFSYWYINAPAERGHYTGWISERKNVTLGHGTGTQSSGTLRTRVTRLLGFSRDVMRRRYFMYRQILFD